MLRLTSPAFEDGQEIAQKFGKRAQNISPPLQWDGVPNETRSFRAQLRRPPSGGQRLRALAGRRPEPAAQLVAGRSSSRTGIPGFTEVKPYAGPFPPSGTHDYEFTLYALRTDRLGVRPGATLPEFMQAAEQNSLATATLIGKFTKIS